MAHKSGLLPTDGKQGLIREVAEIMNSVQSDGLPFVPWENLDFEQIAGKTGREPFRVRTVARLMTRFGLINRRNGVSK